MATPTWVTLANANQFTQVNAATAVSTFTSATDISPGGSTLGQAYQTIPAQLYPGMMWRFTANGTWSSSGSPGVSIGVYYGGQAGSPICYGSVGAGSTPQNAASVPWFLHAVGKLTAVGATTGTWQVIGTLTGIYQSPSLGFPGTIMMPQYTTSAQYDTSVSKIITVAAQCSSAAAANAVTCFNWAIEYLTEP